MRRLGHAMTLALFASALSSTAMRCGGGGNAAPAAPDLSGLQSTVSTISGSVGPCQDDGRPPDPGICTVSAKVVAQGAGAAGAALGSGEVALGESGGPFTISGLSEGVGYSVVATADDSAKTASTVLDQATNASPSQPVLSNVTAPNNELVTGEVTACMDDGMPGPCQQTVLLTPSGTICVSQGSTLDCDLPYIATTAPDGSGDWEFTDNEGIEPGQEYSFYATNEDGEVLVVSAPVTLRVPETIAGCDKHASVERTVIVDVPPNPILEVDGQVVWSPGFQNGAIAGWEVQSMDAVDAIFGGFAQQALWIGIDELSNAVRWIETGVTRGGTPPGGVPSPILAYFTAYGDAEINPTVILPNVPNVGDVEYVKTVDCNNRLDLGCPALGAQWVTCVDTGEVGTYLNNCFTWSEAVIEAIQQAAGEPVSVQPLGPGMPDFHVGMESTCGASEIDTTKVERIRYRTPGLAWSNIHNLHWARSFLGGFPCTSDPDEPCTSAVHGQACCHGTIQGPFSTDRHCVAPKDFFYYQNPTSSTTIGVACQ